MAGTDSETIAKPKPKTRTERPRLWKVILLNDDFTPRDFVVRVLKAVFRMTESEAYGVMLTAHKRGASVVAVFTRELPTSACAEASSGACILCSRSSPVCPRMKIR